MDKTINKILKECKGYDTEIAIRRGSYNKISFENKSVKEAVYNSSEFLSLSLGKKGSYGFSQGVLKNWADCVRATKKIQRASSKNTYFGLPPKKVLVRMKEQKEEDVDIEKEVKDILYLIKEYNKNINMDVNWGTSCGDSHFASSNGRKGDYSFKASSLSVNNYKSKVSSGAYSISRKKIDYEKVFKEAEKKFKMGQNPKKIKKGKYNLVFNEYAVFELLSKFQESFYGDLVQEGRSILKNKLNQKLFSENLTITDDGNIKNMMGTSPFDSEGTPTQKTCLLKKGVVKNFLYDFNSGKRDSVKSTGNCGSLSTKPSVSPHNTIVAKGDGVSVRNGEIEVNDLVGTHMLDSVSGNFSLQINGYLKEKGKYRGVKETVVSGNMFEMLKKCEVGNEQKVLGSFLVPWIKFNNVHVIA